jgi:tetratricopeptide (TPR) repeat protein
LTEPHERANLSIMSQPSSHPSAESPEQELSKLERFLTVDPGNPKLFTDCAELALRLKDYETLLRAANARLRLQPMDVPALSARAKALLAKREFSRAAVELEKVAVARPTDPAIQQDLGLCYYDQGDFEWAKAPLEAALQLGERNSSLLRPLISTWHHLGLLDRAAELAAANSEAAQKDAGLAGVYALLYLDLNRVDEASEWARRALSLDPGSIDALTVEEALARTRG